MENEYSFVKSLTVSWQVDSVAVSGTLVKPPGAGPFPGVILVAGTGPTDRDWTSPLLPGSQGAAPLLTESLARAGFPSFRYKKRAPHHDVARARTGTKCDR